jgi:hypothetical protein
MKEIREIIDIIESNNQGRSISPIRGENHSARKSG